MKKECVAMICHEANRAYCLSIGDMSQPSWDDAPDWQKSSALAGVEKHMQRPLSPQESHESWMATKASYGWVYGPVKDPVAKTHPCMVKYDDLPDDQKIKDVLFGAICAALVIGGCES